MQIFLPHKMKSSLTNMIKNNPQSTRLNMTERTNETERIISKNVLIISMLHDERT